MVVKELITRLGFDVDSKQLNKYSKKIDKVKQKGQRIGGSMMNTGKKMSTAVSLPLAAAGGFAVKAAVSFDDSMRKVMAVSGATGEGFEKMKEQARKMGEQTTFTASQSADAMKYLAMAGYNSNEIMKSTPKVLELAGASAMDLGQAADITSNILTAFGMKASQTGELSDILAKAASSANTNVSEMGHAMKYAAPFASNFGVSVEKTSAAVMTLSNAGMKGQKAGTGLRQVFNKLSNMSKSNMKTLNKWGLSADDISIKTHGLQGVIENLAESGVTASEDISKAFGARAGAALSILAKKGGKSLDKFTEKLKNSKGAAGEMYDKMQEGPGGTFRRFMSALESMGITLGNLIAKYLMPVVKAFRDFFKWVTNLPKPILNIVVVLAGLLAAIGPLLIVFGAMVKALFAIKAAMIAVNAVGMAGPIGIIIGALIALIAIITLVIKHWDKIVNFFTRSWEWIKTAFQNAVDWIKGLMQNKFVRGIMAILMPFLSIPILIIKNWSKIINFFRNLWTDIVDIFNTSIEWIKKAMFSIDSFFDNIRKSIVGVFKSVWDWIKGVFSWAENAVAKIKNWLSGKLGKIASFFGIDGGKGSKATNNVANNTQNNVSNKSNNINMNNNVSVQVPEGTKEEQKKVVQQDAKKAIADENEKISRVILASS